MKSILLFFLLVAGKITFAQDIPPSKSNNDKDTATAVLCQNEKGITGFLFKKENGSNVFISADDPRAAEWLAVKSKPPVKPGQHKSPSGLPTTNSGKVTATKQATNKTVKDSLPSNRSLPVLLTDGH
jgi:hypothetical protein